jgi:adenylyltransferase/sulfurtransferase
VNPEVDVVAHEARLTSANALEIMEGYDLVVDGSDNFPTRYLVNDASVMLGIPSVYGAIFRFDGQASVFGAEDGPCYRCLFREPPPPGLVPSCAEAGVLGILPGIVGTVQATEAIKLILGKGRSLAGRLLLIDALEMQFRELEVRKDPDCPVCGEEPEVTELIDYEAFCGVAEDGGGADEDEVPAIGVGELERRAEAEEDFQLLDVREAHEWEICNLEELGAFRIPMGDLPDHLHELDEDRPVVVHCRSGGRSARAVELLRKAGYEAVNLEGGVLAWAEEIDPEMSTY